MRRLVFVCVALLALTAGCLPVQTPSLPGRHAPTPVSPGAVGPYWHQGAGKVGLADALAYYAALKVLSSDQLAVEHGRLLKAARAGDQGLAQLQLVMLACLPGQPLVDMNQALTAVAVVRQNPGLSGNLDTLMILVKDQLASRSAPKSPDQECSQALLVARKKANAQSEELAACRAQRDDLATKLQKLRDIERGLIDRGRKK